MQIRTGETGSASYCATSGLVARAMGLTRYCTGLPCKNGHLSERDANTWNCLQCKREQKRERERRMADDRRQRRIDRVELIRHLWLEGWSDSALAARFNTSRGAMQRQRCKMGLPPRAEMPEIQAVRCTLRYVAAGAE